MLGRFVVKMILRFCARDAVGDAEETVHVLVAAGARLEQQVAVLDDERVIRAGDELHEHPVAGERPLVGGEHDLGVLAFAPRASGQYLAHQARLSTTRRAEQDQHAIGRRKIRAHEVRHRPAKIRVGLVEQHVVGHFLESRASQFAVTGAEVPVDDETLIAQVLRTGGLLQLFDRLIGARTAFRPHLEDAGAVVALVVAVAGHEHAGRGQQHAARADALGREGRVEREVVEYVDDLAAHGPAQLSEDR